MARVLVPLAQGCEELEAVTITDLLVRGEVEVVTASLDDNRVITASRGMQLVAQCTLAEISEQKFDMVILPGGLPGADYLNEDHRIHQLLKSTVDHGGIAAAVCAAPKVLKSAGLLNGKTATSYPGILNSDPTVGMKWINAPVVEDGQIITSRGPGTAMEFSLTLLEKLKGDEVRLNVEQSLVKE